MSTFGDSCISCHGPSPAALWSFPTRLILCVAGVQVGALALVHKLDGAGHLHLLPRLLTHIHNLRDSQLLQIHARLWHDGLATNLRYLHLLVAVSSVPPKTQCFGPVAHLHKERVSHSMDGRQGFHFGLIALIPTNV